MATEALDEREDVMKARTHSRWATRVALGLAIASILVPAAQAQEPYGELYQHTPAVPYGELYQHEFLADGTPVVTVSPQAEPTVVRVSQAPSPYGELYQHTSAGITTPTASDAIDWMDAGVGAGIALGALLLASAGALVLRRRGLAHS
jgi:hypothetical protein